MQVFMKLTGIHDHIATYILVFTHDTSIYAPYWYLRTILVFTCDTGIYAQYYSTQQLVLCGQTTNSLQDVAACSISTRNRVLL